MFGFGVRRLSRKKLRAMAVMLARYVERGFQPLDALRVMMESSDRQVADAAASVVRGVEAGMALDEAMEHDGRFSPEMVEVVRAAQQGGGRLFEELAATLEFDAGMRKQWRGLILSAGLYGGMALAMTVMMAFYVAPAMVKMAGGNASSMASSMMEFRQALMDAPFVVYVLVVGALVFVGRVLWTNEDYRAAIERWIWRIPMVGRALYLRDVATAAAFLGLLNQARVPFSRALEMTRGAVSFVLTKRALRRWAEWVDQGMEPGQAFERDADFWPRQMKDFLRSGLRSGALGNDLKVFSEIVREEVLMELGVFSGMLTNLVMGVSVAWAGYLFVSVVMMTMLGMMDRLG